MVGMVERLRVKVAVFLLLEKQDKYLFSQRCNTGYADGLYSLPSGHVDPGEFPREAMVREAREEIGLDIDKEDLHLVHIMFVQDTYVEYYFKALQWKGEPINAEPEKCSDIRWASISEISNTMSKLVAVALNHIDKEELFSEVLNPD
jgi:8-oxo-dGTP diphosphatase